MAADRETVRDALATLLGTALVGSGLPAQAVYNYRKGDWAGASPVVEVSSRGSDRRRMTARGSQAKFFLQADVYVLYSDEASWGEDDAEDALDEIEHLIAGVVESNQVTAQWRALDYAAESERYDVSIGGVGYIWERVTLVAEVFG